MTLFQQMKAEEEAIERVIAGGATPPLRGTKEYVAWRQGVLVELGLRSPLSAPPGSPEARRAQLAAEGLVHELATMLRESASSEGILLASSLTRHATLVGHKLVEIISRGGVL